METSTVVPHDQRAPIERVASGPRRVTPMPVEYLVPNPYQPRLTIDPVELQPLVDSIKRYGFFGHIEARHDPADHARALQIVYGHRRVEAAKQAGLATVPVAITERSDDQMRRMTFVENAARKALSYWEEAHFLGTMKSDLGLSVRQIAEALSLGRTYVQERLDLLKLPEGPLRDAVKRDEIGFSTAWFLLQMPEDERNSLFPQVVRGDLNVSDLRRLLRARTKLHQPESLTSDLTLIAESSRSVGSLPVPQQSVTPMVSTVRPAPLVHQGTEISTVSPSSSVVDRAAVAVTTPVVAGSAVVRSLKSPQTILSLPIAQVDPVDLRPRESGNVDVAASSPVDDQVRGVFFDRTVIPRHSSQDYAIDAIKQLEANLFHLRQKLERADFTALDTDMRDRLVRAKAEFQAVLTLMP